MTDTSCGALVNERVFHSAFEVSAICEFKNCSVKPKRSESNDPV